MKRSDGYRKKVFICSRYAGDVEKNVEVAKALCRMAIRSGYAPFAPHLLYTRFLDDDDPKQRVLGIRLGLKFMESCDEVWVYTGNGISEGMQTETERAHRLGKPIMEIQELTDCQLT
ncbi:MAG: DUF4406 domain-containing protein [Armatimonadota bacterium]